MKKRFAAIVMSTLMAVSMMAVPAFAESEAATESASSEPIIVNWDDVSKQGAELLDSGDFVTFDEIAITMWVPNVLAPTELTDEDKDNGYIGYYQTADQSAAIGVQYVDVSGMTLEEYKEMLPDNGATEIADAVVNGLPAVSYDLKESNTACVAFATQRGYIVEISGAPTNDEGFAQLLTLTLASIQATDDAETESTEA